MKILKKEDTSDWKYLQTCIKCDSDLEIDKSDVICEISPYAETFIAKCCVCSNRLIIPSDKFSKLLKIEIIKNQMKYRFE